MTKIIAILEDNEPRAEAMCAAIADSVPDAKCVFFNNVHRMIEWLRQNLPTVTLLSLDHDLDFLPGPEGQVIDPGDGRDVASFLAKHEQCCPVIVHTSNSVAASSMMFALQDAGWRVARVCPQDDLRWIESEWIPTIFRLLAT